MIQTPNHGASAYRPRDHRGIPKPAEAISRIAYDRPGSSDVGSTLAGMVSGHGWIQGSHPNPIAVQRFAPRPPALVHDPGSHGQRAWPRRLMPSSPDAWPGGSGQSGMKRSSEARSLGTRATPSQAARLQPS